MFKTKDVRENQNTHFIMFNKHFSKNHVVYEIMWEATVELDMTQMTVWRMNIQCWLTIATDTHSEYVILRFFTATVLT